MLSIKLVRYSKINRDFIFGISTDIEQFSNLMPKYFKSLNIIKSKESELIVSEDISFLWTSINVKTKHLIKIPDTHQIHIVSGPLNGTTFNEIYESKGNETKITIDVYIQFNGLCKILYVFQPLIKKQVAKVMDEFILACENRFREHAEQ